MQWSILLFYKMANTESFRFFKFNLNNLQNKN